MSESVELENTKVVVSQPDTTPDGVENLYPEPFESEPERPHYKGLKYKRSKMQREEDLIVISKMILERRNNREITDHINSLRAGLYHLSKVQIYHDGREIERRAQVKVVKSIAIVKGEELDKIEQLEREATDAWHASKEPEVVQRQEEYIGKDGTKYKTVRITEKRNRHGEAAFIAQLVKLSEARRKLLGLDSPQRAEIDVTGTVTHQGLDVKRAREMMKKKLAGEIIDITPQTKQIEEVKQA